MAKEELDRASISASETAVNVKQQDVALLLKKKNAVDQQAETTEAEAHVEQAAVVAQEEALMVASADSVFASDGAYMVAQAGGTTAASGGGISTGTLLAIGGVALVGGGIAIAASDDDDNKGAAPTAIAGPTSVNEGASATFTVTGEPNTTLTYVITGVQAEDVTGGALTGQVVLDANGNGVIAVQLVEDNLTEGAQTLTVTVDGVSAATTVNDTSLNEAQDLTSAVETVDGTDQADTFNGSVTAGFFGPLTGETANAGDIINGLGGDDTFNIDFQGSPIGGAVLADVTTNSVENINVSFNTLSGGQNNAIDAVTFNDVEDLSISLQAPTSNGGVQILNLQGELSTLSIDGADANPAHASGFATVLTGGAQPLTVDTVTVSDLQGSAFVDLGGASQGTGTLSNIPTVELSNIATSTAGGGGFSATLAISVLGTVTDGSLSLSIDEVGSISNGNVLNVGVQNATNTTDILTDLSLEVAGGTENAVIVGTSSNLSDVTITGPGDLYLVFTNSTQISSFDASAAAGDIATSLTSTVDLVASFGAGDDLLALSVSGDVTVDMGAGNNILGISVSGDVAATFGAGNDIAQLSGLGGDLDLDLGAGNDVLVVASGQLDTSDIAVGGDGNDTLAIDANDFTTSTLAGVGGFENLLAQGDNGVTNTYDLSLIAGVTTLTVGGFDLASGPDFLTSVLPDTFVQVSDVNANYFFDNVAASTNELVLNFGNTDAITVDRAVDNGTNSLTVRIGNSFGDEDLSDNVYDQLVVNALTADDEDSLTIDSTGYTDGADGVANFNEITTLNADDAATLTITGDKDLELGTINTAGLLTLIDASAFTGDLIIDNPVAGVGTTSIQFIGGSGVDEYTGTANGDTVNGNAGNDLFTLGAAGQEDTIILDVGDALIDGSDVETYEGFVVTEDTIDLGAFGFTGSQASAIGNQNTLFADFNGGDVDEDTVIADFFSDAGVDRGVMTVTNGTDTYVVIDANKDGDFQGDTDVVVFLDFAVATVVTHSDFGF